MTAHDSLGKASGLVRRGGRDIKKNIAKLLVGADGVVVQLQQIFLILSNHPVSGHKVANASFSYCQRHPSWPGGAIDRLRLSEGTSNSGRQKRAPAQVPQADCSCKVIRSLAFLNRLQKVLIWKTSLYLR